MAFATSNAGLAAVDGTRERIDEFCRRHHLHRLSLFGSVLREDFGEGSDIDVLVEFETGHVPGLIRLAGMEIEPGELLGRNVDLVTPRSVSPHFRESVRKGAVPLHDAA